MEERSLVPNRMNLPRKLIIFPLERKPLFPGMLSQLIVERKAYMNLIDLAIKQEHFLGLVMTKNSDIEKTYRFSNLYRVGAVAKIHKKINLPDGGYNIFITVQDRFRISRELTLLPPLLANVEYLPDKIEHNKELTALTRSLMTEMKQIIENNPIYSEDVRLNMVNIDHPGQIADFITSILDLKKHEQQKILETSNVHNRIIQVLTYINREQELLRIQKKIKSNINENIEKHRREHFLREMLQEIKKELGESTESKGAVVQEMRKTLSKLTLTEQIRQQIEKELGKFENMETHHPEYVILHSYLERVLSLPWNDPKLENVQLSQTQRALDKDHYGLEKVKSRIVEFLAVSKIKNAHSKSILCLVGPPGVGKTSIARSIAESLKRKLYHFSVGGMRDEAEIRGHRRTYIGAMPGKIMQGLLEVREKNPIFVIDEIDKISSSYMGDPSSALLEILDPVQNTHFRDLYIDLPFDLSQILFITTANSAYSIPSALLDRMEVIRLSGYIDKEKSTIARKYIIPKSIKEHGLHKQAIKFDMDTLTTIATQYARESGMRRFEREIHKIIRKCITAYLHKIEKKKATKATKVKKKTPEKTESRLVINKNDSFWPIQIRSKDLHSYLGIPPLQENVEKRANVPGTSVGLAWTSMGGDVLVIETQKFPGKGLLRLTGKLGEVMRESAHIALSLIKTNKTLQTFGIDRAVFETFDFHLHVPEGATPKDGPSAGITIASAFLSLILNRTVQSNYAMTGELSLVGNVLPIGGLREKIVAAKRNKVLQIIIPEGNQRDLEEIPGYVKSGLKIRTVSQIDQVFSLLFPSPKGKKRPAAVAGKTTAVTKAKKPATAKAAIKAKAAPKTAKKAKAAPKTKPAMTKTATKAKAAPKKKAATTTTAKKKAAATSKKAPTRKRKTNS